MGCLAAFAPVQAVSQGVPAAGVSYSLQQSAAEDPGNRPIPIVIWAPKAGSRLGLIVISHGTGAGPTAHIDTAQALAEAGFVVVAPMHPGDNFQDDASVGKSNWFADRSRHVARVIDYMLTDWEGHARIAPRRIGIFGFSAGGTTALISVGGAPDLGRVTPHCASAPEFVCQIMRPNVPKQAPQWTHDKRIAAAVVTAPGIGFAFPPNGLKHVRVPVQLWAGSADETVPYASNTAIVRNLLPQAPEFHNVDGAVHLSFLAPCTAQTPAFLCQDRPGFDRAQFHASFNQSVTAFFQKQLKR
ncbi:alpha/beta hydrolase family protein [Novosphingobium ginsenosidimutans]|uniref:alpha/beta hydrolase family protein n=1 Tax=Novosphingobium ginsenosidimutans TaxID=1176536 RepID=UPI0031E9FED5